MNPDPNVSTAALSDDGLYRYELTRRWAPDDSRGGVVWIMANPSTADADIDDPTIRRCIAFSKAWDYRALTVVNLYAWRATKPADLNTVADPVGPANIEHTRRALGVEPDGLIVAAWGAGYPRRGPMSRTTHRARIRDTLDGVDPDRVCCLGRTDSGDPRHPLYVPAAAHLQHYWPGR